MQEPRAQHGATADPGRSSNQHQTTTQDIETSSPDGDTVLWPITGRTAELKHTPVGDDTCPCGLCVARRLRAPRIPVTAVDPGACAPSVGVDLPGVGRVAQTILCGSDGKPGDFPDTLRTQLLKEEIDRELVRVLFAAAQTAELCMVSDGFGFVKVCRGCGLVTASGEHKPSCSVGALLASIERLKVANAELLGTQGGAR